jgi:hypothetical protein
MIFPVTIDAAPAVIRAGRRGRELRPVPDPASATLPGAGLADAPRPAGAAHQREHATSLTSSASTTALQSTSHRPAATSQAIVLQPLCCISLGLHRNVQIARVLRITADASHSGVSR